MTLALCIQTIVFGFVLGLLLYALTGQQKRSAENLAALQEAHEKQLQGLLQRLQAPEAAVHAHSVALTEPTEQQQPLTDQESAIAQDALLALDMIDRHEANIGADA